MKTWPKLTENQVVLREFNRSWNLSVKVSDTFPVLTLKLIQVIHWKVTFGGIFFTD